MTPDPFPDIHVFSHEDGGLIVDWEARGIGHGQLCFCSGSDGQLYIINENMSREFIKKVMCTLIDNAILEDA